MSAHQTPVALCECRRFRARRLLQSAHQGPQKLFQRRGGLGTKLGRCCHGFRTRSPPSSGKNGTAKNRAKATAKANNKYFPLTYKRMCNSKTKNALGLDPLCPATPDLGSQGVTSSPGFRQGQSSSPWKVRNRAGFGGVPRAQSSLWVFGDWRWGEVLLFFSPPLIASSLFPG